MLHKTIHSKGLDWLVYPDGTVATPAHSTSYTRVRNGKSQTFLAQFKERRIAPYQTKNGYLEVSAKKNGKRVKHTLHRLIGMAFVPGFAPGLTINHKNGNKLDNRHENLEWVSLAKNTEHQWATGLVNLRGEAHPASKLSSKQVVYIRRLLLQGIPCHQLAVIAGVSPSLIEKIQDGRAWGHLTDPAA